MDTASEAAQAESRSATTGAGILVFLVRADGKCSIPKKMLVSISTSPPTFINRKSFSQVFEWIVRMFLHLRY